LAELSPIERRNPAVRLYVYPLDEGERSFNINARITKPPLD
jgi:hypothetical protein